MYAIETHNLTKTYDKGKVVAVNEINFGVEPGELFGLIGPDGAGKTTIFRLLATLLLPVSGTATVATHDIVKEYREIRKKVGYMPGKFSLYQDLTIEENLKFFATLFGTTIEENYDLIKEIYQQIEPFKDRRAGNLSGGMKQKLALSCALIHKPEVLFLDEPTTGIDPVSRVELWDLLQNLKSEGITILVSTPYMDEAVRCERVALIQNGNIMQVNTPKKIVSEFNKKMIAVKADDMYQLLQSLEKYPSIENSYAFGEYAHALMDDNHDDLSKFLQDQGLQNITIKEAKPTIEDVFIDQSLAYETNEVS